MRKPIRSTSSASQALENRYQSDPAWNRQTDPALEARFQRVRAKLSGYVDDARQVLVRYPESNQTIPAHYARAYAWHRTGHPDEANAEADACSAPARTIPISSSSRARSCSRAATRRRRSACCAKRSRARRTSR